MASAKWINDLSASTPLADAARRVLSVRLEVVRDYLGLAVREPEKNIEYVHQLRVGTRRSRAALDIFADCLPKKEHRTARRYLRNIRRAAGAARDWDVFLETLGEEVKKNDEPCHPGLDCLIGYAFAQRLAAQDQMVSAIPDPFEFDRFYTELLHAVREPANGESILIDLARPTLIGLVNELDADAAKDMDDIENLHQVRITGKQLRYAMEVFAGCFPPEFRKVHYAAVEEMQEILGRVNDSDIACDRLSQLAKQLSAVIPKQWKRFKPDLDRLLKFHDKRLPDDRKKFDDWWQHWQHEPSGKTGLVSILHAAG